MNISKKLIDKYNIPVPRYTSYPPANHFRDDVNEKDYVELIQRSNNGKPEQLSFYIHIPFCKKICFYCGCNTNPMVNEKAVDDYITAVKKEIEIVTSHIHRDRLLSQIHFGGGTPNAISSKYIIEIKELIVSKFKTIAQPEIAIECNPAYLDEKYIVDLKNAGFNRFSLGIQDFDENILSNVNRDPSKIPVNKLIELFKQDRNDVAVNLDFIYGLPGQTVNSFLKTIEQAVELKPDRLVTFSYAHVPWIKKHQQILEKKGLPEPEQKMQMFLSAYELLKSAGYQSIGLDHYVLPKDELFKAMENHQLHRNFQGYCTRRTTGQVYAFGVSGISQMEDGYVQNTKNIKAYTDNLKLNQLPVERGYKFSPREKTIKEVINTLMCNQYLHWENMAGKLNLTVNDLKQSVSFNPDLFDDFVDDGLLIMNEHELKVTEKGSLFIRNVAATLDPEYKEQLNKYSKSV
ncbi:MAG: oxygen-independent coproporphyrinogen III oxidase [Bacteroidales bacterium]